MGKTKENEENKAITTHAKKTHLVENSKEKKHKKKTAEESTSSPPVVEEKEMHKHIGKETHTHKETVHHKDAHMQKETMAHKEAIMHKETSAHKEGSATHKETGSIKSQKIKGYFTALRLIKIKRMMFF